MKVQNTDNKTHSTVVVNKKLKSLVKSPSRLRQRVSIQCLDATRTKQSFKDECDINNVLKKYKTTGQLPGLIKENPRYGDFADVQSYQESLNTVIHAQEQFNALSSDIRKRFGNDPAEFLEFATDPKNLDEMVKLGLAVEKRDDSNDANKPTPTITEPVPGKKDENPKK